MDQLSSLMANHSLQGPNRIPIRPAFVIDTDEQAAQLVSTLTTLARTSASNALKLYMDFEGINLCRSGRVCIGQLTFPDATHIYLLDFVALPGVLEVEGSAPDSSGTSLRSILEGRQWTKFIFDPRADSDALYHTCGKVLLANVLCLQLCEVKRDREAGAYRRVVNGLKRVLNAHVPSCQRVEVNDIKSRGLCLFAPELGGSYAVFEERPLSQAIIDYCRVDVAFFGLLEEVLYKKLSTEGKAWVVRCSAERVACCLERSFKKGKDMAIAPK